MFQETQEERAGVDLSPPGALEAEIGKFIVERVDLRNAENKLCSTPRSRCNSTARTHPAG